MARGIEEALTGGAEAAFITINAEKPRKGVFEVAPPSVVLLHALHAAVCR